MNTLSHRTATSTARVREDTNQEEERDDDASSATDLYQHRVHLNIPADASAALKKLKRGIENRARSLVSRNPDIKWENGPKKALSASLGDSAMFCVTGCIEPVAFESAATKFCGAKVFHVSDHASMLFETTRAQQRYIMPLNQFSKPSFASGHYYNRFKSAAKGMWTVVKVLVFIFIVSIILSSLFYGDSPSLWHGVLNASIKMITWIIDICDCAIYRVLSSASSTPSYFGHASCERVWWK